MPLSLWARTGPSFTGVGERLSILISERQAALEELATFVLNGGTLQCKAAEAADLQVFSCGQQNISLQVPTEHTYYNNEVTDDM